LVNRVRLLIMAIVLVPLLVLAGSVLLYDSAPIASSPNAHFTAFSVGGKTFKLTYLATNQSALQTGLGGKKVTASTTMLFVFPSPGYYPFWMYGVNSSLDIIWVDAPASSNTGQVVYLELDAPPCQLNVFCQTFTPTAKADFVIEAQAGFAAANGVTEGTAVSFS
jgi:uncharacterized membrane protein (UPF0127 family)